MSWFALRVDPGGRRDAVVTALFAAGASGVQEDGASLLTYFRSEDVARGAAGDALMADPAAHAEVKPVADQDWTVAWRREMRAFSLGSLTVAPPWLADGLRPESLVVIDPGMAFGTGDHASTRGALRLLPGTMRRTPRVADLGTGSGVLAIAAARLGAERVYAIDDDPDALGNAAENIARNDAAAAVLLFEGDARVLLPLLGPVNLVVANINARVVADLLPVMRASLRPGGRGIIAGILESERAGMLGLLQTGGWEVQREDVEEEWWSATIAPR